MPHTDDQLGHCDGHCVKCNQQRAARAASVLDALEEVYGNDDNNDNVQDFLTDLLHYADQATNPDFGEAMARAVRHHEVERG